MQWGVPSASSCKPNNLVLANFPTIRHQDAMITRLDLGHSKAVAEV